MTHRLLAAAFALLFASPLLAGIDEYLFKPVDSEMIRERLGMLGLHVGEG